MINQTESELLALDQKIAGLIASFTFFYGCELLHEKERELGIESEFTTLSRKGVLIKPHLQAIAKKLPIPILRVEMIKFINPYLELFRSDPAIFKEKTFKGYKLPISLIITDKIEDVVDEYTATEFLIASFCFAYFQQTFLKFKQSNPTLEQLEKYIGFSFYGVQEMKITENKIVNDNDNKEINKTNGTSFDCRDFLAVATNPVIHTISSFLGNKYGRESLLSEDPDTGLAYYRKEFKTGHCELSFNDGFKFLLKEEVLKLLQNQGVESAWFNSYLTGKIIESGSISTELILDADDILKDLGWERKRRKNREELLLYLKRLATLLDCFRTSFEWKQILYQGRKKIEINAKESGRAWQISTSDLEISQKDLLDNSETRNHKLYITVKAGIWAKIFLNQALAEKQEALFWYGYLSKQISLIDPVHEETAFLIALHLIYSNRVGNGIYTVRELLRCRYSDHDLNLAVNGDRNTKKEKSKGIRKNWQTAISTLHQLGWKVIPIDYPEYLRPAFLRSPDYQPDGKRHTNLLKRLFDCKIQILQPDPIPELLESIRQKRKLFSSPPKKEPNSSLPALKPESIKESLKKAGLSQDKVARLMGISKGRLVRYLAGNLKSLTANQVLHLKKILNID